MARVVVKARRIGHTYREIKTRLGVSIQVQMAIYADQAPELTGHRGLLWTERLTQFLAAETRGAMSRLEIEAHFEVSDGVLKRPLRLAIAAGTVVRVKKSYTRIDGGHLMVPAYQMAASKKGGAP